MWLPATGYALMLAAQPDKQLTDTPTVVLPRPLGGSWTTDPPVPVVTAGPKSASHTSGTFSMR